MPNCYQMLSECSKIQFLLKWCAAAFQLLVNDLWIYAAFYALKGIYHDS